VTLQENGETRKMIKSPRSILTTVLILVAIHSFCVGIGLVFWPITLMRYFGFGQCSERFFPTQGGVFHIVMSVGYMMAALDRYRCLVFFSIVVKVAATIFLFIYFFAVDQIWLVLLSGVGDGIMAILISLSYISYYRWQTGQNTARP
jgi:hypothetical protein